MTNGLQEVTQQGRRNEWIRTVCIRGETKERTQRHERLETKGSSNERHVRVEPNGRKQPMKGEICNERKEVTNERKELKRKEGSNE